MPRTKKKQWEFQRNFVYCNKSKQNTAKSCSLDHRSTVEYQLKLIVSPAQATGKTRAGECGDSMLRYMHAVCYVAQVLMYSRNSYERAEVYRFNVICYVL